jgi:hypothetical protein
MELFKIHEPACTLFMASHAQGSLLDAITEFGGAGLQDDWAIEYHSEVLKISTFIASPSFPLLFLSLSLSHTISISLSHTHTQTQTHTRAHTYTHFSLSHCIHLSPKSKTPLALTNHRSSSSSRASATAKTYRPRSFRQTTYLITSLSAHSFESSTRQTAN